MIQQSVNQTLGVLGIATKLNPELVKKGEVKTLKKDIAGADAEYEQIMEAAGPEKPNEGWDRAYVNNLARQVDLRQKLFNLDPSAENAASLIEHVDVLDTYANELKDVEESASIIRDAEVLLSNYTMGKLNNFSLKKSAEVM